MDFGFDSYPPAADCDIAAPSFQWHCHRPQPASGFVWPTAISPALFGRQQTTWSHCFECDCHHVVEGLCQCLCTPCRTLVALTCAAQHNRWTLLLAVSNKGLTHAAAVGLAFLSPWDLDNPDRFPLEKIVEGLRSSAHTLRHQQVFGGSDLSGTVSRLRGS